MDIKGMYQDKAEEIAEERYNKDYYSLMPNLQLEVYNDAMLDVHDNLAAQADMMNDRINRK